MRFNFDSSACGFVMRQGVLHGFELWLMSIHTECRKLFFFFFFLPVADFSDKMSAFGELEGPWNRLDVAGDGVPSAGAWLQKCHTQVRQENRPYLWLVYQKSHPLAPATS